MEREIKLSEDEIMTIVSSLEHEREMYEFVRGFGKKTHNEIIIQRLIDRINNLPPKS